MLSIDFGSIIYKMMSLLMSILLSAGAIGTPATDNEINTSDPTTAMTFIVGGDTQVSSLMPSREEALIASAKDMANSACPINACVIVGDVAENGLQAEYDRIYDDLRNVGIKNWIFVSGNHDIRMKEYEVAKNTFTTFANRFNSEENAINSLYYTYTVNGYKFIVMGSEATKFEKAIITERQLKWLDRELESGTEGGKPAFVLLHYPLKDTHGLPDTWSNAIYESGDVGDQSNAIKEVLAKHENAILITGHLHTGFGQYSYEKIDGKIDAVNVPSIGIENKDGGYNNNGTAYFVEVTPTRVLFRARDFAKGKFVPEYDIEIPVER